MSLRIFSLNIEGHKHIQRWLPIVQKGTYDVVLLQEIFEQDVHLIAGALGMQVTFAPMLNVIQENKYSIPPMGKWGIALATKLEHSIPNSEYYVGSSEVKNFDKPNDASRVLLSSEIMKDGKTYRVATTHFTWTPNGESNAEQERDFTVLAKYIGRYNDWILSGDFNAPRGKETFTKFTQLFRDNLPKEITSTLDPNLHYAGKLDLAVDTVFTTPHYQVEELQVLSGLSDHCGLHCVVERVDATTA